MAEAGDHDKIKLVSSWPNVQFVPESYVHPPEKRPGKLVVQPCKTIPVVDFEGHDDQTQIIQQILKATEEFGFFQVINHGVSKKLMDDAMGVFKEFHGMSWKDKTSQRFEDPNKSCRFYRSSEKYKTEEVHVWRDALTHPCHPLEEYMQFWPEKPTRYREVVGEYVKEVRKLGDQILGLLCQGLGLSSSYFSGGLVENPVILVNHYPPCPDPSLTLGLLKHRDPSLITILLQEEINGLQVFKDGEWIGVEPLPHAFVVNGGYVLQMISNGKLKGAEHRAVTNSSVSRTSAAFFIYPSKDSIIEPAKALINAWNPPQYRSMKFEDFQKNFLSRAANNEAVMQFISSMHDS